MMDERRIDVMGMAEMGRDLGGGYVLMYKGVEEGFRKHGVEFIIGPRMAPYIQSTEAIHERLVRCTFKIKGKRYHFYQVYAPQQGHSEEEKREFIEMLEQCGRREGETVLLMGDFNTRVGRRRNEVERMLGPYGEVVRNTDGEILMDFCLRCEKE